MQQKKWQRRILTAFMGSSALSPIALTCCVVVPARRNRPSCSRSSIIEPLQEPTCAFSLSSYLSRFALLYSLFASQKESLWKGFFPNGFFDTTNNDTSKTIIVLFHPVLWRARFLQGQFYDLIGSRINPQNKQKTQTPNSKHIPTSDFAMVIVDCGSITVSL
jgi:hypothetical protein